MQIRDLGSVCGVTPQTIRYYERRGLLPRAARDRNGYRQYDEGALSRLQFIRSAQAAALTLAEIASIFTVRQAGDVPCEHVSTLIAAKLEDVHRRQGELVLLETELHHLLSASKDLDPADCEAGSVCHIIAQGQSETSRRHGVDRT